MEVLAPSGRRIVTMVAFALSCLLLLTFLWVSFGGTVPLGPQGYRIRIAFPYADQLGTQADVRIAGVSVGKVLAKTADPAGDRTVATIQIENQFAPVHQNATAMLREKTIIGETYVDLTPGTSGSPRLPDGGTLAHANVQPAVQLSQILDTLDSRTRGAFRIWQQQLAKAVSGNHQNLNSTLGNLPALVANLGDLTQVLDVNHGAVVKLVQNGALTFAALSRNRSALRGLITSGDRAFAVTGANNDALAATFHVFPTFLTETRRTMSRLRTFALNTDPLLQQLQPVAVDLTPTLQSLGTLSPDLRRLFVNLGPLITVSKAGLPAVRDVLRGTTPLLASVGPFLEELNPILDWLSLHQQLTADFISLAATASAARTKLLPNDPGTGHYLRSYAPVVLDAYKHPATVRDPNVRGNDYPPPLWIGNKLNFAAGGHFPGSSALPSWDCNNTSSGGAQGVRLGASPVEQACWVAPTLPGAKRGQIPHVVQAHYPSR